MNDFSNIWFNFLKTKSENFGRGTGNQFLEDLSNFYDARISINMSCRNCDNYVESTSGGTCSKHNINIENPDKIPDQCKVESDTVKDLIKSLDIFRKENYVKAHFEG